MPEDAKVHISLVLPRRLYERLTDMRWERRASSFVGMLRNLLQDSVDRHDEEYEKQVEVVS